MATMFTPDGPVRIKQDIRKEGHKLWGRTLWFVRVTGFATNVERYYYSTREQARNGKLNDGIGQRGRVR